MPIWERKSSKGQKVQKKPPLPIFQSMRSDRPMGPRDQTQKPHDLPPPPPDRAGSEKSEHNFTITHFHRRQETSPDEPGYTEFNFSRKPLPEYNIENPPRLPGHPPSQSAGEGQPLGEDSDIDTTLQSLPKQSHSSPHNDGKRASVSTNAVDRTLLQSYAEQYTEIKSLREANRTLEAERDSVYQELRKADEQIQRLSKASADAVKARDATVAEFKPMKKSNEKLREEVSRLMNALSSKKSEIQKLQIKIKGHDEKIEKQRAIWTEARRLEEERLRGEKQDTEHRLRDAKDRCELLGTRVETLQLDKKKLEKKVRNLEESLRKCNADVIDLETAKKALQDNCAFLERELGREAMVSQERNSDIRKAQESAFKIMMEPANWMPKADSEVRRMLDKIADELWSWTKASVVKEFNHKSMSLHRDIEGLAQMENGRYYFSIEDPRHRTKLPALVCKANITLLLYNQIFGNPFFWQTEIASGTGEETARPAQGLYDIYMDIVKDDEKGGNEWRCQMLRTFDPSIATEDLMYIDSDPPKPEKCRRAAIARLVENFLSRGTGSFLDSDAISDENCIKELNTILRRAARLSYRLWTQKTRISILGISQLGLDNGDGVSRFSNGAELVQHHAYHNVELARDDQCLNGKPIVMMTHPAVIVYGDSSGENYGSYKVWKKAEAWMG